MEELAIELFQQLFCFNHSIDVVEFVESDLFPNPFEFVVGCFVRVVKQ